MTHSFNSIVRVDDHHSGPNPDIGLDPAAWETFLIHEHRVSEDRIHRDIVDAMGDLERLDHGVDRLKNVDCGPPLRSSETLALAGFSKHLEVKGFEGDTKRRIPFKEVAGSKPVVRGIAERLVIERDVLNSEAAVIRWLVDREVTVEGEGFPEVKVHEPFGMAWLNGCRPEPGSEQKR